MAIRARKYKKKTFRKKILRKPWRRLKRSIKRSVPNDPTIQIHNKDKRPQFARVVKSLPLNTFTSTTLTYGQTGLVVGNPTSTSVSLDVAQPFGIRISFDPQGNLFNGCNNSGYVSITSAGVSASSIGPCAIGNDHSEFIKYSSLYQFYKVNRIRCRFTAFDRGSGGLAQCSPNLYLVKNKMFGLNSAQTPTLALLSDIANVCQKTFTQESPQMEYTIVPTVYTAMENQDVAGTNNQPVMASKMKWIPVGQIPPMLYGLDLVYTNLSNGCYIAMDVEYDISFKTQY